MKKYKVFTPDKNGKVSFTKAELEQLLNEIYNEGYTDGQAQYWSINYGRTDWWNHEPYYTTSTSGTSTNGTFITGSKIEIDTDTVKETKK